MPLVVLQAADLKSPLKNTNRTHCSDNVSSDGNKETDVTKDIIQKQPNVTFANEDMLNSNEKILIESHYTDNMSYDRNKDTDVALVRFIICDQPQ